MLFPRINEDTMVNQEGNKKRIWIFKQFLDYKPIRDGLNRKRSTLVNLSVRSEGIIS